MLSEKNEEEKKSLLALLDKMEKQMQGYENRCGDDYSWRLH